MKTDKTFRFGSVCSGIEAASVAFAPLGWKAAWLAEIEKFPCAVLKHHYPDVPNLGDMTKLEEHDVYRRTPIDLLCGGTPCQSFSVAGLRGGIKDARGNLCLTFCKIAIAKRPRFVLWENVPGVLSSGGGQDFGCFLAGLSGADAPLRPPVGGWNGAGVVAGPIYGLAWRVLDAQHFGVPQRRRRVFVVGYLGDWRRAARILFEPQSMPGDSSTGGEAGQGPAAATEDRPAASLLTMREGCDGGGKGPLIQNGRSAALATANAQVLFAPSRASFRYQNEKEGIVEDGISATIRRESTTTDERSVPAYVVETQEESTALLQESQEPAHRSGAKEQAAQPGTNTTISSLRERERERRRSST